MSIHADEAIVLGTHLYSDTSLIVGLLSAREGKLRLVAKGARRPQKRTGTSLEPGSLVYAEWSIRAGAELGILRKCEQTGVFRRLWSDLDAMMGAGRLLRTVDRLLGPHEGNEKHFRLLLEALRALDSGEAAGSVEGLFLVMLLERLGLAPSMGYCPECTKKPGAESALLDLAAGELRCLQCRRKTERGVRLRAGAVASIREALRLPADRMRSMKILPPIQAEVIRAARAFLAFHTRYRPAELEPDGRGSPSS